jgi:hypothetical protein
MKRILALVATLAATPAMAQNVIPPAEYDFPYKGGCRAGGADQCPKLGVERTQRGHAAMAESDRSTLGISQQLQTPWTTGLSKSP